MRRYNKDFLLHQCSCLSEKSLICVDDSDISNPESKQMEVLLRVWDGSIKQSILGYNIINFVVYNPSVNGYELLSLSSEIYSELEEVDSEKSISIYRKLPF